MVYTPLVLGELCSVAIQVKTIFFLPHSPPGYP